MSGPFDDLGAEPVILGETPEEEPSFLQRVGRRAERYAQRGVESVIGLPGDIVQLTELIGEFSPGEKLKRDDMNFAQRWASDFIHMFPSSEELRARSSEIAPHLEPESEFEDKEDEFISDLAVLALPVKGKIPFARALGTARS